MNVQEWIEEHPYLAAVARFEQMVDHALDAAGLPALPVPDAEVYVAQLERGTPLLLGEASPDLAAAAEGLRKLAEVLATEEVPEEIRRGIVEFRDLSRDDPHHAHSAIDWAIAPDGDEQDHPIVIRLLSWRVLRRMLVSPVRALAAARGTALWPRGECPTCGSMASMAQLVDADGGRRRMLVCACCQTTWQYKRVGCQYCGNEAQQSLAILELEGEADHRLDVCKACGGYTKTLVGRDAELFAADWTTLHLDVIAAENGYQRRGASLYDVSGTDTVQ
jgi:FdhE protein